MRWAVPRPNPSILFAKATGVAARAAGLALAATAPEMRQALHIVELNARECRLFLQDAPDVDTLREIEANLARQATRLDELEDKLRASADAKP